MNKIRLGKEIKALSNEITRYVSESINLNNDNRQTTIQFLFIDYIGGYSTLQPVFQRDLEAEFNIRRSTATGILQGLEKNGMINRQASRDDARLKEINLTPQGTQLFEEHKNKLDSVGKQLVADISDQDIAVFQTVMNQIYQNITIIEEKNKEKGANNCD